MTREQIIARIDEAVKQLQYAFRAVDDFNGDKGFGSDIRAAHDRLIEAEMWAKRGLGNEPWHGGTVS